MMGTKEQYIDAFKAFATAAPARDENGGMRCGWLDMNEYVSDIKTMAIDWIDWDERIVTYEQMRIDLLAEFVAAGGTDYQWSELDLERMAEQRYCGRHGGNVQSASHPDMVAEYRYLASLAIDHARRGAISELLAMWLDPNWPYQHITKRLSPHLIQAS